MSYDGIDYTAPAEAAITTTWLGVRLNTTSQVRVSTTDADHNIGICQNTPAAAGVAARVRVMGVSKLHMNATVAAGGAVFINTSGEGEGTPAAGAWCVCQAFQAAAAADDIIEVFVDRTEAHA
jgi:hypothetical protein